MVKVITIMDDVYSELFKLKRTKGLSFSGAIRLLLKENQKEKKNILSFAGSINEDDIDRRAMENAKRGMQEWRRSL